MSNLSVSRISLLYAVTFVNHALVSFAIMMLAPLILHGYFFPQLVDVSARNKVLIFGLLLSCKPLTEAFMAAWFYRSNILSPEKYLRLFLLIAIFSLLLFAFALWHHQLVIIFIAQSLFGIGCAAIFVIQVLLVELSTKEQRTLVLNFMEWSVGLGMSLGPIAGAYLARWGGSSHPATPYCVAAVVVLILFAASSLLFSRSRGAFIQPSVVEQVSQPEQTRAFYYCLVSWLCFMLGWQGYFHWFPVLALQHYHFDHAQLNRIYIFIGLFSLIFQLLVVSFFTRYSVHRKVLYLSLPVIGVSIILMPILHTIRQLYVISGIYIVAISFLMPFWKAYLSLLAWQTQKKLFSSMTFVTAICALAVTSLGGLFASSSLTCIFIIFGFLILVAMLLMLVAERRVKSLIF